MDKSGINFYKCNGNPNVLILQFGLYSLNSNVWYLRLFGLDMVPTLALGR